MPNKIACEVQFRPSFSFTRRHLLRQTVDMLTICCDRDTDYLSLSLVLGAFQQLFHSASSSPLKFDAELLSTFHRRYYAYNTQTSINQSVDQSIKFNRFITVVLKPL